MRENRLYGSEGRGRRKPIPTPISSSLTFPAVAQERRQTLSKRLTCSGFVIVVPSSRSEGS